MSGMQFGHASVKISTKFLGFRKSFRGSVLAIQNLADEA